MSRRVCYDTNGNEIYEDAPTYAQEQLEDIERRRETVDELKSQIEKYKVALELASVDVVKYMESCVEECDACPERAYCESHRRDMTLFDCGNVFLKAWKEKAGLF